MLQIPNNPFHLTLKPPSCLVVLDCIIPFRMFNHSTFSVCLFVCLHCLFVYSFALLSQGMGGGVYCVCLHDQKVWGEKMIESRITK